jgi:hypothetical protein
MDSNGMSGNQTARWTGEFTKVLTPFQ